MYIESIINDYFERNDFEVSSFGYLMSISEDYKNKLEMESMSDEIGVIINTKEEINDLPF